MMIFFYFLARIGIKCKVGRQACHTSFPVGCWIQMNLVAAEAGFGLVAVLHMTLHTPRWKLLDVVYPGNLEVVTRCFTSGEQLIA